MNARPDFRKDPKCPFGDLEWRDYYWEFPRQIPDYEYEYWTETFDPDGVSRNMLSDTEWENMVADTVLITEKMNKITDGGRALDIGCGRGGLLSNLGPQWEKHGVEPSPDAAKCASAHGSIIQGDLSNTNYDRNSFNLITLNHVIEHLANPLEIMNSCQKLLAPCGILMIATPDFDSPCARRFGLNYRMLHDPGHISLFTSFSLVKMLEDLGFKLLEIDYPFFETRFYTREAMSRMSDPTKVSPPFVGNHINVFAEYLTVNAS